MPARGSRRGDKRQTFAVHHSRAPFPGVDHSVMRDQFSEPATSHSGEAIRTCPMGRGVVEGGGAKHNWSGGGTEAMGQAQPF